MRAWSVSIAVLMGLGLACVGEAPDIGAPPGSDDPPEPLPACDDPQPLTFGDAPWDRAPFRIPGEGEGDGSDDDGDDGGDEPSTTGLGFIDTPDGGGGVDYECDLWAQDCPEGQKCMPWANDGGMTVNASKCSPLDVDPATHGEPCSVEGGAGSGVDDCDLGVVCWEPDENLQGNCVGMCQGSEANPSCPYPDTWCWIGPGGVPPLCLDDALCVGDGACRCLCPEGEDPDCEPGFCTQMRREQEARKVALPPSPTMDELEPACPQTADPAVVYMSNDDSNSQASPALVRRSIREGRVVTPGIIRIHEFLNYYDFTEDNPANKALRLGMQMRRSDAVAGEFTFVVSAQGRAIQPEDRPPFNLVFSLDTSGSMMGERMELLKESMTAVAGQLRAGDTISVVTWNDQQQVVLDGHAVSGAFDPTLVDVIEKLQAGGSTDLHAGLVSAYALANAHHFEHGINRVILVSDGGANTGVTDIDLIASEAHDGDGEGTYLVGVGVGTSDGYRDDLMDAVTDAGKGAYVFVDSPDEAWRSLGDDFLANVAVAARDVRMKVTLPWYFGIREFHGEKYSSDPAEVEPQHLAPNDAMTFHQIIGACDPSLIATCDVVSAEVTYRHPVTGEMLSDSLSMRMGDIVQQDATLLRKGDAIVAYAKALIVIGHLVNIGQYAEARKTAGDMARWLLTAATELDDVELLEAASLMRDYDILLADLFG